MSMILDGSNGVTFNDASLQGAAASPYVLKNRIINGDFRIDQRNAGAAVTPSGTSYNVDRWKYEISQASKFTIQQNKGSVTPPAGFTNYLGFTTSTAYTVGSGDYFLCEQYIEGFNTADLAWGTANAKTITLSFWVYSSLTGTFGGNLQNGANLRFYPFSYTISSANTWEQKTITIVGDTTGTWSTNNDTGILVRFNLGMGSTYLGTAGSWTSSTILGVTGQTNVVGTLNANWYITGVQLEQNTSATPFERRLYNQELANCQRYYITFGGDSANQSFTTAQAYSTTAFNGGVIPFSVKMRAKPTFSYSALSDFYIQTSNATAVTPTAITQAAAEISTTSGSLGGTVSSGLSVGSAALFFGQTTSARLNFSAEL